MIPTLETERLNLRPFTMADAAQVQSMAGTAEVASTTLLIPHPYPDGAAELWIGTHAAAAKLGTAYTFAIEEKKTLSLLGAISLDVAKAHARGTLGYWIGVKYWNHGFCSEATRRVIEFAFRDLHLIKVNASHLAINPASGQVMIKAGMKREGYFEKHVQKNGVSYDCVFYGLVNSAI